MKRCRNCGERKPLRAFVLRNRTEAKHNTCRACLAARQKARVEQSRTWIRRYAEDDYAPGFQVLCSNGNCGRYRNGGVCPHRDPVA